MRVPKSLSGLGPRPSVDTITSEEEGAERISLKKVSPKLKELITEINAKIASGESRSKKRTWPRTSIVSVI